MDLEDILGEERVDSIKDKAGEVSESLGGLVDTSSLDTGSAESSELLDNIKTMRTQDWIAFGSGLLLLVGALIVFFGFMSIISGILYFHTDEVLSGFPSLLRWYATLGSDTKFVINALLAVIMGVLFIVIGYLGGQVSTQNM